MKTQIWATTDSSHINFVVDMGGMTSHQYWEVNEIRIHLSTAATAINTLSIKQRSHLGIAYDTELLAIPMQGVQDISWNDGPVYMNGRDRLSIAWTNDAASFKTYGIQVRFSA